MATSMASDDITALFDAITGGARGSTEMRPSTPPIAISPAPRGNGVRGSAVVGFGLALALAGTIAVGLRDSGPAPVVAPVVVRATPIARAAPVARPEPVVPAIAEVLPRARAVAPIERMTAKRREVAPRKPKILLAEAKRVVVPIRVAAAEGTDDKAVHLTGVALQIALAEDRVKTRVLNQRQLDRLGEVSSR